MDVIRLKLSNIRYHANSIVPCFIFQGEEDAATIWNGRIEEPKGKLGQIYFMDLPPTDPLRLMVQLL
tara:strand:- start:1287 stop:1487 length:201 start_codon:yes stop_codon:yes gene_type:complete